jgi:hypothetical protein
VPEEALTSIQRIGHIDFISICESMFVYTVAITASLKDLAEAPTTFLPIPEGYSTEAHATFFSLPLHPPSQEVLKRFLKTVRS